MTAQLAQQLRVVERPHPNDAVDAVGCDELGVSADVDVPDACAPFCRIPVGHHDNRITCVRATVIDPTSVTDGVVTSLDIFERNAQRRR